MVVGALDRVIRPCLMHDTHLCQIDVKYRGICFALNDNLLARN